MPVQTLEAQVRQGSGMPIIDLHGEIDAMAENALNSAYATATSDNPPAVLLNFSAVDYINSTGIALIVGLLAKARKTNCRVLACGLSDHYTEIFEITRLSDFMELFADEGSALQTQAQENPS
jgi:anti-sigma B factor antagonist